MPGAPTGREVEVTGSLASTVTGPFSERLATHAYFRKPLDFR